MSEQFACDSRRRMWIYGRWATGRYLLRKHTQPETLHPVFLRRPFMTQST